ncbi:MAG: hypothetical protein WAK10_09295, partial [Methanoregula sp.]
MSRAALISGGEGSTRSIQKSPDTGNDVEFVDTTRTYWSMPIAPFYSRPVTCTGSKIVSLPDRQDIIPGGST